MYRLYCLLMLCVSVVLFTGCGKRGDPIPEDARNAFVWQGSKAEMSTVLQAGSPARCINITADIKGAAHNVEAFLIELEAEDADICRECPFTPTENAVITPNSVQQHNDITRYTFTYCPVKEASSYRWRLVARNVFAVFPYELTTPKVLQ